MTQRLTLALAPSLLLGASLALALPLRAQPLDERVTRRDGAVRMTFDTRPDVCGDGRNLVRFGRSITVWPSMEGFGTTGADTRCAPGAAHVTVVVRDGRVTSVRTSVGEPRDDRRGRDARDDREAEAARDLGDVPARQASSYLLALARRLEGRAGRDAILPAVIADAGDVAPELMALARDADRPKETRKRALVFAGVLGDEGIARQIDALARDASEERWLREDAVAALGQVPDGLAVRALTRIVREGEPWLRGKAVFWLAASEDDAAREVVRGVLQDADASDELRGEAAFALGHHSPTPADGAFLRRAYPRLTAPKVREKLIMSIANIGTAEDRRWLLALVADADEPLHARKQALFWAGQKDASIAELTTLYDRIDDSDLRQHFAFVLSQRQEREAVDKLIDIAKTDDDPRARKQAMFWLGQSKDPRAAQFIRATILGR